MNKLSKDHPVFEILRLENPELFTTDGLINLLSDCQMIGLESAVIKTHKSLLNPTVHKSLSGLGDEEILNRIMADPKGWVIDAPEEVQQGAEFYSRMGKIFNAKAMSGIFTYHSIRDNIRAIQQQLNISGVVENNISIRDRLFSYPEYYDQLALLDSDREVLGEAAPKVINFFFETINIEPKYDLFVEDDDDQLMPVESFTAPKEVLAAEIYTDSHEWDKSGDDRWTGRSVQKLHPDKIKLRLQVGEDDWLYYVAEHPDKSRFPWMD